MTTENEKVVRGLIYKAWAEWRKSPDALKFAQITGYEDATAFPRLFEAGYRAALQSQVSNTPQDGEIARSLREWLKFWIANFHNGYPQKHNLELALNYIDGIAPQQQEQSGEAVKAFGYAVADAINEEHALGGGYLSSAQMHAIVEKVWEEEK